METRTPIPERIRSLARKTDLMLASFRGEIVERRDYIAIRTPSNPGYHWGNYLIFFAPPTIEDATNWPQIYRKEFDYYDKITHMTFTWDTETPAQGEISAFTKNGFELEHGVVLTNRSVQKPPFVNSELVIKKIQGDDWEKVVHCQIRSADPKHLNDNYESFKRKQMANYRAMSEAGMGFWFGAFLGDSLVGDLGLYYQDGLGRYQSVGTDPSYRKMGVCQTLVYETAKLALEKLGISTLVMEADANYHAARVYEKVGFKVTEKNFSLSWWER